MGNPILLRFRDLGHRSTDALDEEDGVVAEARSPARRSENLPRALAASRHDIAFRGSQCGDANEARPALFAAAVRERFEQSIDALRVAEAGATKAGRQRTWGAAEARYLQTGIICECDPIRELRGGLGFGDRILLVVRPLFGQDDAGKIGKGTQRQRQVAKDLADLTELSRIRSREHSL